MKKYDSYKDSEIEFIGEIPSNWDRIRIKALVATRVTDGPHETPEWKEYGVPFLSAEAIKGCEIDFNFKRGYISQELHEEYCKKSKVCKGDILFCKSGSTTGKSAYVNTNVDFGIWSPLAIIRADRNKIDGRFLFQFIQSGVFRRQVETSWTFGTQPNIGMGSLENLWISVPNTLEIQTQIANYLDHKTKKIDTLIGNKEKLIELLKEERTAIINQAVTKGLDPNVPMKDSGIEWLGEIPENSVVTPLKYIIKNLSSGVSVNSLEHPVIDSGELGVLKTSCVYDYTFRPNENKKIIEDEYGRVKCSVVKDSIIISRMNTPELVGASGYVDQDYPNLFLPDRLWLTEFHENVSVSVYWLSIVLISDLYKKVLSSRATGTSASMKNISKSDFLTMPIPLPSYKLQLEVANYVRNKTLSLNIQKERLVKEIELLKEYKTALISEVVTGKVDVRDEALN